MTAPKRWINNNNKKTKKGKEKNFKYPTVKHNLLTLEILFSGWVSCFVGIKATQDWSQSAACSTFNTTNTSTCLFQHKHSTNTAPFPQAAGQEHPHWITRQGQAQTCLAADGRSYASMRINSTGSSWHAIHLKPCSLNVFWARKSSVSLQGKDIVQLSQFTREMTLNETHFWFILAAQLLLIIHGLQRNIMGL